MSLINQMLQDLDKRRAGEAAANQPNGVEANEVRSVAPQKRSYPIWQIIALLLFLLVGVLAVLLLRHNDDSTKPVLSPVAVQPPALGMSMPTLKLDALDTLPAAISERKDVRSIHSPHPQQLVAAVPADLSLPEKLTSQEKVATQQVPEQPIKSKAYEHALVEKQVKELSPQQHAENEYRKAIGLTQQGRLAEAMGNLQQATKLDPFHLSARQMLVALLVEGKQVMEAEQTLQEGLKLSPDQSGFTMMLARLQAGRGEANAALETLHKGLPYASEKADYHALYAALLQRQARHPEAVEQYQAALRKMPNSGVWLMGLGISLQAEKRDKDAEDAFTRAKASNTLPPDLKAFVEQRIKQLQ